MKLKEAGSAAIGLLGGDDGSFLTDDAAWPGEDAGKMFQYFTRGKE